MDRKAAYIPKITSNRSRSGYAIRKMMIQMRCQSFSLSLPSHYPSHIIYLQLQSARQPPIISRNIFATMQVIFYPTVLFSLILDCPLVYHTYLLIYCDRSHLPFLIHSSSASRYSPFSGLLKRKFSLRREQRLMPSISVKAEQTNSAFG